MRCGPGGLGKPLSGSIRLVHRRMGRDPGYSGCKLCSAGKILDLDLDKGYKGHKGYTGIVWLAHRPTRKNVWPAFENSSQSRKNTMTTDIFEEMRNVKKRLEYPPSGQCRVCNKPYARNKRPGVESGRRGMCTTHYNDCRKRVKEGKTTWEALQEKFPMVTGRSYTAAGTRAISEPSSALDTQGNHPQLPRQQVVHESPPMVSPVSGSGPSVNEMEPPASRMDDGPAEINFGDGPHRTYAWAHPHEVKPRENYPVKVGYAGQHGLRGRIDKAQWNTPPRYLLCVRFETESEAKKMEQTLHSLLNFRNRKKPGSLGSEWFETNVQELTDLVKMIAPNVKRWSLPEKSKW